LLFFTAQVCSSGSPITNNNGKNDDDKDRFNSKSTALYEDKLCSTITKTIRFDNETKRILKLGGPFTVSTVSEAVFDAIIVALISKFLGVEALSAAIVTHLLIGLTDTFVKGVADALNTLCSHAIGTENFNLAGEYVQIAMVTYISISLPVSAAWWFFMDDAIRLFGMNERVVMIGTGYSKVLLADYLTKGMFDVFLALLDVTGYESQATVVVLVEGITSVLSLWALLYFVETMDLFWVGIAELGVSLFIYVMFGIFVVYRGWLDPFWHGMTKTFALKNSSAVKNLLHTAIPLSIGSLLEYGEWEALTFFAAALGPAEGKEN
jgi:Na+-driven multidrug efflux pump